MKEIWKLIELLNEWQEKELWKAWAKYLMFDWINNVFELNNGCSLCQELVLSHRFCFVKWLVENDKIDLEKEIKNSELNWLHEHYFKEDCLLMLLSISDTPIEDLISYLK